MKKGIQFGSVTSSGEEHEERLIQNKHLFVLLHDARRVF